MGTDPTPSPTDPRDRIAEMVGITTHTLDDGLNPPMPYWKLPSEDMTSTHPIPPTLDFAAAAWNCLEGWEWFRTHTLNWYAFGSLPSSDPYDFIGIDVDSTRNERTDRLTLLIKVLDWLKANDEPAYTTAIEKIRKVITNGSN